jgi:hypothetical protein
MTREEQYWTLHKIIDGVLYRRCTGECKEWKPETYDYFYYKNKSKPELGFSGECKKCGTKRTKIWMQIDDNYKNHLDYKKEWNKNEENNKRQREHYKQWREDNKEWKQQYQLEYQRKYPEKMAIYGENRRKHKTHRITDSEWNNCLKYFNHRCAYCGLPIEEHYNMFAGKLRWENLNKEHVIHKGGNRLDNCIPSCKSCNDSKWEYTLDEWYNENNPNFAQERYIRIIKWLMEDCFKYMEDIKPKREYKKRTKVI